MRLLLFLPLLAAAEPLSYECRFSESAPKVDGDLSDPAWAKIAWTNERIGCASLILAEGKLIIFDDRGGLHLARANSKAFEPLGTASILTGVCRAHPALADGQIYARSATELVRIDLRK